MMFPRLTMCKLNLALSKTLEIENSKPVHNIRRLEKCKCKSNYVRHRCMEFGSTITRRRSRLLSLILFVNYWFYMCGVLYFHFCLPHLRW